MCIYIYIIHRNPGRPFQVPPKSQKTQHKAAMLQKPCFPTPLPWTPSRAMTARLVSNLEGVEFTSVGRPLHGS